MATLTAQFVSIPEEGATYTITITSASIPADGTLTLSKDPLHIVMPKPDDKYPGVRTLEAEIKVLTKVSMAYMYSDDPLNTSVTIKRNNVTIFYGFLEPSQWQQPMVPGEWNEVQIVAMDALAALKNVPFYDRTLMCGAPDYYGTPSLIGLLRQHCGSDISVRYQSYRQGYYSYTTEGLMKGYFSSEAFIGTDLEDTEAHTFIGDMLQGYARAVGVTLMMQGKTLYVYFADKEPTATGIGDIKSAINDTNIDMEIVPPVRAVVGSWDDEPEPDKPKGTGISYRSYTYGTDARMVACATNGNWQVYDWPSSFTAISGSSRPCLFATATDNVSGGGSQTLYPGVGALEKKEKTHVRVPYMARGWNVRCMTHMNKNRGSEYQSNARSLLPDDYNENTWDESSNFLRSTVFLMINGTQYDPYQVRSYGYESDSVIHEQKWADYIFRFQNISNADIIRARGHIQIGVRSTYPDNTRQLTPHYAKDFSFFWEVGSLQDIRKEANPSPLLEEIDINTPLYTGTGTVGTIGFESYNTSYTNSAMETLVTQYRYAHPQYTGDFKASSVFAGSPINFTYHLQFLGKWHTPMSIDWDCRNNNVELVMLEDNAYVS